MFTSTKQLSYNASKKQFVGEWSSVNAIRAYPDACDVGINLVSDKTGKEAIFAVNHEERDNEGELISSTLTPIPEAVRKNPCLKGVTVLLFND